MKNKLTVVILLGIILFPFIIKSKNQAIINTNVSGSVVDARTNEILPGASVSIKGTTNGANTDANGKFTLLTGQKLPFTVIVSYIGYKKREIILNITYLEIRLEENTGQLADVVVSSRRRQESVQDIPIPISVIRGVTAEDAGAFNPNRLKEMIPSVQLYSSNGRNTILNIRGLGSTFGLTNDGIDCKLRNELWQFKLYSVKSLNYRAFV
jgi:iron complex outermembrane recepter protein